MTTTPTTWLSAQQANTTDTGAPGDDQTGIQLVGLTNGNFVALWESNTDGGPDNSAGGTDIIGQLYDAQGNAIGGEFRANQGFFADDEGDFTAVALSNGNFVIAYEDTDANGTAIRYNILSATGTVVTTGTIASDPGAQDLGAPAITANSDGSFLVAYQQRDVGVSTATFATIVDNAGVAGSPFLLLAGNLSDDVGAGGQQVATATLSNGNYVIVARQLDGDDGFNMRIVNSTGGNVLGFTEVGTTIGNGQSDVQPSVAAITGGFVVVWQNTDANDTDVVFQRYNLSGVAQGGLIAVNGGPTTDNNVNPSVVGLSDGGFVIVHDDNEAGSIVLQRFSATGSAVGTEVTVDTGGVSPTITLSDDGRLLVGYGTSVFTGGLNFDNDVSVAIFDPRENVFSGDGASEVITSRQDGADVSGLGGNDTLLGQGAADTLRGGDGDDSIVGGGGSDVIEGGFNADTIQGGFGDDLIFAMTQADVGGSGVSDVIDGDGGNDTLFGSAAGDTLRGGDNDDSIDGGDGADFIEGGFNADTIFGGLGADVIFAMTQADAQGSGVSDSIDGGDGNDSIVGSAAADTILGGADSDTIDGGGGADTMTGGTGDDFFTVDDIGDKVIEANGAGSGTDTVNSSVSFSLAGQFIERLILTGAGNIDATGNSNANQLTGNSGNNELDGKQGADTMAGAGGSDTYFVDNLGDVVIEANGGGIDTVNSSVSFSLFGQFIEKLTLTGSSNINATGNGLGNKIDGNSGNNKIDGAGGADTMAGGDGNDSYVVNDAGDQVIEANAQGVDKVTSTVTFSLAGQFVENLILDGGADIDGTGNSLGNELTGNSGKNVLNGASGADTLTGGNGQDQFVFANTVQASNVDHLTDYKHGVDKMVLDKSFMSALNVGALTAAEFKNVTTGSVDATDRILYNQTTGELFYDSDGSGSALARLFAVLDNAPTNISNTDFTVVA